MLESFNPVNMQNARAIHIATRHLGVATPFIRLGAGARSSCGSLRVINRCGAQTFGTQFATQRFPLCLSQYDID